MRWDPDLEPWEIALYGMIACVFMFGLGVLALELMRTALGG